jgi:hypothetical protein
METQQREHMHRARQGLLKFIFDRGGSAQLNELHGFSEKKYFIAHQGFSRLMDGVVAEGLVEFDFISNTAMLTESGRAALGNVGVGGLQ